MRKLITIILILFCGSSFGQVYQLMPQYGYQANRMVFDSTLQIPTTCGVPTLKSVQFTTRRAAIAFDSCNNRFYQYNPKTTTWSVVSGGGGSTDTTSLSNRIDAKIDSIKMRNDSVFAYKLGTAYFQFKDTTIGTLQSVTDKGNTTTNSIYAEAFYANLSGGAVVGDDGTMIAQSYEFVGNGGSLQKSGSNNLWVLPNYSDTLVGKDYVIDTLKRSNDSIFGYKNHQWVFQYKDSVGSGAANDTAKVVIAKVHNATGTTLQRGEVVYLFGATGDVASVKRANNKQDSTSSKTFGLVRRDIAAGDTGYITTQGQIEKLNLGSYTAGDVLWLDSIDGGFTKVKPQAPYHAVFLGVVERANNGNGLAYVKPQNGVEVDEIHDVLVQNTINNQILIYSDTLKVWKNRSVYTIVDTTSLSSRINTKLAISDTSVFARKSVPANTINANNTNAVANESALTFKQFGNQTYTDSITITGASNPSGAINHTFRWSQIGNLVTLHITLTYATNGSLSQIAMELPDGLPAPILPTGLTSNNDIICYGTGFMVSTTTGVATLFSKVFLRQNTGLTNDYEIVINQASNSSYRIMNATIQYFAQ